MHLRTPPWAVCTETPVTAAAQSTCGSTGGSWPEHRGPRGSRARLPGSWSLRPVQTLWEREGVGVSQEQRPESPAFCYWGPPVLGGGPALLRTPSTGAVRSTGPGRCLPSGCDESSPSGLTELMWDALGLAPPRVRNPAALVTSKPSGTERGVSEGSVRIRVLHA